MGRFDEFEAQRQPTAAKGGRFDEFEAERSGGKSPSGPRKTASDFLAEEGTIPTRVRNWGKAKGQSLVQQPPTRRGMAETARPYIEGGAAVAGGLIGVAGGAVLGATGGPLAPLTVPGAAIAGELAGNTLGYGIGAGVTNLLAGKEQTPGADLKSGAMMGMVAPVVAAGAGKIWNAAKNTWEMGVPFSPTRNRISAAREFGDAATGQSGNWKTTDPGFTERQGSMDSNRLQQVKRATRNRDDALFNRLNADRPGGSRPLQPSAGQQQGGKLLSLEQKQRLKYKTKGTTPEDMPFDERVNLNSAVNADAALTRVTKQLGRGEQMPASEFPGVTGKRLVDSVRASEAEVKPEVRRLFNQPAFKYEMPRTEFEDALESVLKSNLDETARADVEAVDKFAHGSSSHGVTREGADRTAGGLKSIKETIDSRISQAVRRGDQSAVNALGKVKQGVFDSFEAMGQAAESGDVALHEGRIIYPSKIKSQIATLDERIATEKAAGSKPDIATMRKEMGAQPGMMKITGESDTTYAVRLTQAYEKAGKPVPMAGSRESAALPDLLARRTALQDTLTAAKPAEDVAATYASARKYTAIEQKDRFARDTISGILKKGDQYGGLNTAMEAIPDKVFTPSGAFELVKAKMPFKAAGDNTVSEASRMAAGQREAGQLVYPHVVTKFTKAAIDPVTGNMSIPAAERFLRDNGEVLRTLGLTRDVEQIIKGQLPKAVKQHLDGLGVDSLKNPTMSARLATKFVKKQFGPSIGKYFGSTRAVMDWAHTLEIAERSNVVASLRGPNTAEKLDLLAIGDKVSMFGAVLAKAGWVMNSIKGAAGAVVKNPMAVSKASVDKIIQDGLMDGNVAKSLLEIHRAKKYTDISQRTADILKPYFIQMQVEANQPTPEAQ